MCTTSSVEIWTWPELRATQSRRAIEQHVRAGELRRIRRGVYASPDACGPAISAAEHGGSVACETAARHLGLWVLDEPGLHVWMRSDRHHRTSRCEDCDCTRHWDAGPSTRAFDLPSTPRILLQIFRCRGGEAFFVALESARRLGLISRWGLRWLRSVIGRVGRDLIDFSRADADSGLESLVRLRLREYGWDVRTQVSIVGTGQVDLLIDGWLIIEADGKENHDGSSPRHRDLVRDANSAAWGHVSLRFDYALIVHDWDLAERAIVSTMRLRPVERAFGA
jgi:very-short-patch-repair endonuclease